MARTLIVGVMGPGEGASAADAILAERLGRFIAERGWILLTGGRAAGVMDAASRGARAAGGLTIGLLPGDSRAGASAAVIAPLATGLGNARNNLNVLASDLVVAVGERPGAGTVSEIALALKADKPTLIASCDRRTRTYFEALSGAAPIFADDWDGLTTALSALADKTLAGEPLLAVRVDASAPVQCRRQ